MMPAACTARVGATPSLELAALGSSGAGDFQVPA